MSTSLLYHTFGVWGYEYRSTAYGGGGMTMTIEQPRQALCCSQCGGKKVHAKGGRGARVSVVADWREASAVADAGC